MKQDNVIDLAEHRQYTDQKETPPQQLDELSVAILSLIERLRESKPLQQTG